LVYLYSTIKMMHGPINIRLYFTFASITSLVILHEISYIYIYIYIFIAIYLLMNNFEELIILRIE
jgi:hypothetical protein